MVRTGVSFTEPTLKEPALGDIRICAGANETSSIASSPDWLHIVDFQVRPNFGSAV